MMTLVERICLRDEIAAAANQAEARRKLTTESDEVQARIGKTMEQLATYQDCDGVFTKTYVKTNAKSMPPANWWAMYGRHIPLIRGRRAPRARAARLRVSGRAPAAGRAVLGGCDWRISPSERDLCDAPVRRGRENIMASTGLSIPECPLRSASAHRCFVGLLASGPWNVCVPRFHGAYVSGAWV